jgi:hypothetical protein
VHHEQALIAAFVKRNKRDRYREFVANPRLRHKFANQLAHFADFDPKYRLSIPSNKLFVDNIAIELQKRHSPQVVFAISEDPVLDQKELPLVEALSQIVARGMGTVLCCIPGSLAFVKTEDERFILERHDALRNVNTFDSLSVAKTKTAMSSRESFRQLHRLLNGTTSWAPTPKSWTCCERGSARTWRNQLPSDVTSFSSAFAGSRPAPPNTSRAYGKWSASWNATAFI